MTLSILVFNFYPVTSVMIVLLALLNDGAILSIAYDSVKGSSTPVKWNMPLVFTIAISLGVLGVIESFGLFYIGDVVYHLPKEFLQTMIYLKLSLAGHLTVFVARTKGFFWTKKPSAKLFGAVVLTQIVATIIAAEGLFMYPIGWQTAGLVWIYCLIWFVIEDLIKVGVYFLLNEESKISNWRKLI
jgi:H+-transporting ATPase